MTGTPTVSGKMRMSLPGSSWHEALARGRADLDRALDEQEPRRVVGLHVDVEDGAAHGDRCRRHVDHVGRLGGEPRDEAERAAHEVHHDGAAVDVGIVDELVEQELGAGPERELGLVAQLDLAAAFIVDGDELLGAYAVSLREVVLIVLERRRHDADNGDGRSDRVSRRSKCRGADKAGNDEGEKAERVSRQPHGRCTFAGAGSSMRARNRAGAGMRVGSSAYRKLARCRERDRGNTSATLKYPPLFPPA